MNGLIIISVELLTLYVLSRRVTQALYLFATSITRSTKIALSFVTLLLFPGTVVHELSHLFTAEILGVRTGKLTLVPESLNQSAEMMEEEAGEITAGSVGIAKTDPIRRMLIGIAPLFVGIVALSILSYFLANPVIVSAQFDTRISAIITYYLLFALSNSMFSSSEDMKGVIPVAVTLGFFAAAGYIAGFRFALTGQALEVGTLLVESLTKSLGLVLAINIILLLALKLLTVLTVKILYTSNLRR